MNAAPVVRPLENELHENIATLRLSPAGMRMLNPLIPSFARAGMRIEAPEADGFRIVTLSVGSVWQACGDVLRFGAEVEVLGPSNLRRTMSEVAQAIHVLYAPGDTRAVSAAESVS